MLKQQVVVVRPYGKRIRDLVFGLLEEFGCDMEHAMKVAPGTSDQAAIDEVIHSRATVLLVPFHGHRDETGSMINGLTFLAKLVEQKGSCPWRVVMPVSRVGRAGFMLAEARLADKTFGGQLTVVLVEEISETITRKQIQKHLADRR